MGLEVEVDSQLAVRADREVLNVSTALDLEVEEVHSPRDYKQEVTPLFPEEERIA